MQFHINECIFFVFQRWTINKQMKFEGGFQGRTNKLVDGCYSFWCGAVIPIVQKLIAKKGTFRRYVSKQIVNDSYLFFFISRESIG